MKYLFSCLLFLSACVFFYSCEEEIPEKVLSKDKMVNILKDLHLGEAYVNVNYSLNDSSKYMYHKFEDSTLKAHGTDEVTFDSSMAYYSRNIKLLDEIYALVVDSLSLKEGIPVTETVK